MRAVNFQVWAGGKALQFGSENCLYLESVSKPEDRKLLEQFMSFTLCAVSSLFHLAAFYVCG